MPDSIIKKPNQHFDATLYTGVDGVAGSVVNAAGFKPDLVWAKSRAAAGNHVLADSVRGVNRTLYSNGTSAEVNNATELTAFNSNGFSFGTSGDWSNGTHVGWQWKAGGASTVNTSGSISSNVSVSTTAGFSIVTYTGTGTAATVGHGLGVAPRMIIAKRRNTTQDWGVYHASIGNTGALALNLTIATDTNIAYFNNTSPTSSVFSLGSGGAFNASTGTYVAYCWAEVEGYSKFGSYTGNGSTDGPFVYLGFRPKFILAKRTDTAGFDWILTDSSRSPSNVVDKRLFGNTNDAESSATTPYDYLSNGFKLRNTNNNENASGATYIYMAFAEAPFKYSSAR
jgi:hypothetical protein